MISHPARNERRKQIAAFVKSRITDPTAVADASTLFGVSLQTVQSSCREHNVRPRRLNANPPLPSGLKKSSYSIIADLFNPDLTYKDIAARYGITTQRVGQIYKMCREAGIPVRLRTKGKK